MFPLGKDPDISKHDIASKTATVLPNLGSKHAVGELDKVDEVQDEEP